MIAILPGAETGVDLADKLAARLGTRNNGEEFTEARRNKYLMGEQVSCLLLLRLVIMMLLFSGAGGFFLPPNLLRF